MRNNGLFSSLFIEVLKERVALDDTAQGRMATLAQTWHSRKTNDTESLWGSFLKQALAYLEFVPPSSSADSGVYPLYEDYGFTKCISVLYLIPPGPDIDDTSVGRFYPAKLLAHLKEQKLNWGILTDGSRWRLYSTRSSRPYEDYVELQLAQALETSDEPEYGLFERFFHRDSFIVEVSAGASQKAGEAEDVEETGPHDSAGVDKCRLDQDRDQSEKVLEQYVKEPFLAQVDEVLQYICNGFIFDTKKSGEEYTEEERAEIFESAVKLIYRCLFLFYAEARRLLPTDPEKTDLYLKHSIQTLCREARKFRWGHRRDTDQYDLWKHLKGLINAVNEGDPEYGIMGYNGGLFDDEEERFLGQHQLRNDFLSRALYLLAFVEPYDNGPDGEYPIPYEDLEVRHLGELYENILEYTVLLADADRFRRRTKKGVEILLVSQTTKKAGDAIIKKGDVYFGESALERKQTGSYYTAESLVRFLNEKTIIQPLRETFERKYRKRFDDLLEQAKNGHNVGTRRGAAQSAAALVERFAEEEIFHFKVCDPAMGSGHFLVDAANQMAGLVVELLAEVPYVEGMTVTVTSHPNNWRRRITRHCIYGVDLNPLAVNLAKLSLWLNCFAIDHKLTFLDHHLRCGNSLIGIRSIKQLASIPDRKKDGTKNKQAQRLLFNYNDLSKILADAAKGAASITRIDEDDTDRQKAVLDQTLTVTSRLSPLADLYTAYLMDSDIPPDDYKEIFERLAEGKTLSKILNPDLSETLKSIAAYRDWHLYFHWPLEFPAVFGPEAEGGFSATVGNPPWDIVKPNSQEFFADYDPKFRSYDKQKANREATTLMTDNPSIADKWKEYCDGFAEQSTYFKEPFSYSALGKGDINTFKLFLEQFFTILIEGGRMGIVVPSGIYTDQGCQPLRERFFNKGRVQFLFCFSNEKFIFKNVHHAFRFVAFSASKGEKTDKFKACFLIDPREAVHPNLLEERLQYLDKHGLEIPFQTVMKFSPDTLSVMEFKSQRDIDVTAKIYGDWPLLGEKLKNTWNVQFNTELHMTNDSHLFVNPDDLKKGHRYEWLWEGKQIWLLSDGFAEPTRLVSTSDIAEVGSVHSPRVAYRALAASTNERTLVATVIPSGAPVGHSINVCPLSPEKCCFLAAILSSFVVDWVIRNKVTTNLTMFYLYQLPIVRTTVNKSIEGAIVARAARLISGSEKFAPIWKAVFLMGWQSSSFWYPPAAHIDTYGPAHEQEIRRRLSEGAKSLTLEWGPHCGVHDRLPDRRDTGNRAQLRAEIDAYAAHLYGLSRENFAYILDAFPVLKKKEEKAFGEFISKRKCLEEYDRIGKVLNVA